MAPVDEAMNVQLSDMVEGKALRFVRLLQFLVGKNLADSSRLFGGPEFLQEMILSPDISTDRAP